MLDNHWHYDESWREVSNPWFNNTGHIVWVMAVSIASNPDNYKILTPAFVTYPEELASSATALPNKVGQSLLFSSHTSYSTGFWGMFPALPGWYVASIAINSYDQHAAIYIEPLTGLLSHSKITVKLYVRGPI